MYIYIYNQVWLNSIMGFTFLFLHSYFFFTRFIFPLWMDCYIPETRITKVSMSGSGGGGIAMRAHDQHWGAATPGAHAYVTMATIVAPSPRSCDISVRGLNLRPPLPLQTSPHVHFIHLQTQYLSIISLQRF